MRVFLTLVLAVTGLICFITYRSRIQQQWQLRGKNVAGVTVHIISKLSVPNFTKLVFVDKASHDKNYACSSFERHTSEPSAMFLRREHKFSGDVCDCGHLGVSRRLYSPRTSEVSINDIATISNCGSDFLQSCYDFRTDPEMGSDRVSVILGGHNIGYSRRFGSVANIRYVHRHAYANPSTTRSGYGIAGFFPLESSKNRIDHSDDDNRNRGYSGNYVMARRVAQPFDQISKFHWVWFLFGCVCIVILSYGVLLFMYGLGDRGSGVILLKGLGLSVVGWIGGVFFLFHWLYQR